MAMLFEYKLCNICWPLFTKLVLFLAKQDACLRLCIGSVFCVCRPQFSLSHPDFIELRIRLSVKQVNMSARLKKNHDFLNKKIGFF